MDYLNWLRLYENDSVSDRLHFLNVNVCPSRQCPAVYIRIKQNLIALHLNIYEDDRGKRSN